MVGGLAAAVESPLVPAHGAALADCFQHYDRLFAAVTMGVAEVDRSGEWELDGSVNMAVWMRQHLGVTTQTANRMIKTARRLRDLPVTARAWLEGELSSGQVEVIVANLTDRRAPLFADHEPELIPLWVPLDVLHTLQSMQDWAARADSVLDGPEPPEEPSASVIVSETLGGRGYVRGAFDKANLDVIRKAIDLAVAPPVPGEPVGSFAQRRGQALVDVCRHFLDHHDAKPGNRNRPHLNVVIPLRDLIDGMPGRTMNGTPVDAATIRRLACDANVHRVITDGASSILDYGRATRTIPPAVYTSLTLRDRTCRFPGCDRQPQWCEGHHVQHWEHGGVTNLGNLVLLCSKHHHRIHMPGWHIKLHPTGTVDVTSPDGTVRTSDPPRLC
jgi:hypothetical protein